MTFRQAILVLFTGAVVLAGCSAPDPAAPPADTATDRNTAVAADCGDAATKVKEYVASSKIRKIAVNGQCTNVTIETELDNDDTAEGRQICEAAGKVAYTGDINSITVLSKSGTELSTGIDGARCLP